MHHWMHPYMEYALIDAIGPFFRGLDKPRINWSKIPFEHLGWEGRKAEKQWSCIYEESEVFGQRVSMMGYNTVMLDDLAHLIEDPLFDESINRRNRVFIQHFRRLFKSYRDKGLGIMITADVLTASDSVVKRFKGDRKGLENWYLKLVERFLENFPEVSGLIFRIGESDGLDVRDAVRSHLHLKNARQVNHFLRKALPVFERMHRKLILRNWTVGAYRIGDLIWHRSRVDQVLRGIDSPAFILSLKHGESDFFRYLPVNRAFFRTSVPKILELQARREYEGGGEYPSFIGWDCEEMARELAQAKNMIGFSIWCQTGGWHAFKRRPFVCNESSEAFWIELNCVAAYAILFKKQTVDESVSSFVGNLRAGPLLELLRMSETVIRNLYYIPGFAEQKLFFRRVRLPPILHVYWDSIFCTATVRKLMRYFVSDHEEALRAGESVFPLFEQMEAYAKAAEVSIEDIQFMRDTFGIIALARRYYFLPWEPEIAQDIVQAKKRYKRTWPRRKRARYRIKTDFKPFKMKRRTMRLAFLILLRRKRGYRIVDHMFTLRLLSILYCFFHKRTQRALPNYVRESAMGIDSLFK